MPHQKRQSIHRPSFLSPASSEEQIAVIGPAILALCPPNKEVAIPPIPLMIVIALIGGLYPWPINTPIAWAFSAPITKAAKGIEILKKALMLKAGTKIWGATNL